MPTGERKTPSAVGFLTVVEHDQHGLMGGYLVLNTVGRPLEFHCTAPVKPNRAQQILYGATLEPYLYGEQIGQALVTKSGLAPLAIFTDRPPALATRMVVDFPLALVLPAETEASAPQAAAPTAESPNQIEAKEFRIDEAHPAVAPLTLVFRFGRNRLSVPAEHEADRAAIQERLAELAETFDLAEPFDRIREAIEEAQRVGR